MLSDSDVLNLLSNKQIDILQKTDRKSSKSPDKTIISMYELAVNFGFIEPLESYKSSSLDLNNIIINPEIVKKFDIQFLKQHVLLPFDFTNNMLFIACQTKPDIIVRDQIKKQLQNQLIGFTFETVSQQQILEYLERLKSTNLEHISENKKFAIEVLQNLIQKCVLERISDIHLEPQELIVRVRVRKDGILKQLFVFDKIKWPSVCVRIKLLAGIDISQSLTAQDGKFELYTMGRMVDLRVSTRPIIDGENIVIRILDKYAKPPLLNELGYTSNTLAIIRNIMQKKQGIFIATGPTGAGKSTLLFAMLKSLASDDVSIATIEDPIEYTDRSFRQTDISVYKQMSFSDTLRSILRQDPDIISISEIRDHETATMAMRAAMTGRMLLTTLHTTDILGVFDRMEDLGVSKERLLPHLSGIAMQRLLRKLCTICKGESCESCEFTGYKGRIVVCKAIKITDQLIKALLQKPPITTSITIQNTDTINDNPQKIIDHDQSFEQALLEQVQLGNTDMKEVLRVWGYIEP